MLRLLVLLIALSSFVAPPCFAEEHDDEEEVDYARSGLYAGGGVLLGSTRSNHPFGPQAEVDWDTAGGIDAIIGWRETEHWAIELELEWLMSRQGIEYGNWAVGMNAKYYILTDRWQPYVVNGVNGLIAKVENGGANQFDWGFRHGLGVDYYLGNNVAVSLQSTFVWGVGDLWKHYYVTGGAGILYRF